MTVRKENGCKAMRLAYADPPYIGCAERIYGDLHPEAAKYDDPQAHIDLMTELERDFDGWALSCNPPDLRILFPAAPKRARVGVWVKPYTAPQRGRVQKRWEPLIYVTPVGRGVGSPWAQDWHCEPAPVVKPDQKGWLTGMKPPKFTRWMLSLLGAEPSDEIVDFFHGSGAVSVALQGWREAHGATADQRALPLVAETAAHIHSEVKG